MTDIVFEANAEKLAKELAGMADRITDKGVLLRRAGGVVRESIRTNFAVGGRPEKWQPLKVRQGQPLRDTGRLQNSITSRVRGGVVLVGTNVEYAAVQNFGAKKGSFGETVVQVRAHQRTGKSGRAYTVRAHPRKVKLPRGDIPARPFMLVQDEDIVEIEALSASYIMEGKK